MIIKYKNNLHSYFFNVGIPPNTVASLGNTINVQK